MLKSRNQILFTGDTMNKIEILAPVGGQQQLIAAVRSGADAVYLGTKGFNARANAENFDSSGGLPGVVGYCHSHGVRVHVTLNTLLKDSEIPAFTEELKNVAASGADAVIVQDLTVAKLIRECCPELEMHASTQMAVHSVEGAKMLEKLGFRRVVLARELTFDEIKQVIEGTSLQVEIFVHGALCVSASGLCELSAMIGGRSGNRGQCAQPCRLDFRCGSVHNALSLKDMSHIQYLPQMAEAGVTSVKIEGRMKRPEYVAAAVTACRQSLAGEEYDIESLQAVFSRSGFTDGYFTGRRTKDMFGYRTKEDVAASQTVLKKLAGLYNNEFVDQKVDMSLTLRPGEPASLALTHENASVTVEGAEPEPAQSVAMSHEVAKKSFERTGGTQYYLGDFTSDIAPGYTLRQSEMNRMRREGLEKLDALLTAPAPKAFTPREREVYPAHENVSPALRLRFEKAEQLFPVPAGAKVIMPLGEILKKPELTEKFGDDLMAEIPAICFPSAEKALHNSLDKLASLGVKTVSVGSMGAVGFGLGHGFTVCGAEGLNILNSTSASEYKRLGLKDITVSIEMAMDELRDLPGGIPRGLVAYGYLPLMKFRACPGFHQGGCAKCKGLFKLTDRKNESFTVICRSRQFSELLNCVPLYVAPGKIRGADFATLYFTTESADECRSVTDLFLEGGTASFRHTNGLYFREVL